MSAPSFRDFYREVHDRMPFPWQERLASRVIDAGWPAEIGVPTGLGKTATIDIAVWALAVSADTDPSERVVPTRIWYVVDRRLLVDAASEHATRLSSLLASPSSPALREVAARLQRIAVQTADRSPLWVAKFRGGAGLGLRPPHPAYPAVICTTVAMYASRLLFRGYGTSNRMWPIDAALAGIDALVLLDEAHLAPALAGLVEVLPLCDANHAGVLRAPGYVTYSDGPAALLPAPRARPQLVSLTATGNNADRFDLDESDRRHPTIATRLRAAKPTSIVAVPATRLAKELAETAATLLDEADAPMAGVVFVNTPRTAREVRHELEVCLRRGKRDADLVTVTGQMRPPDADAVRAQLLSAHAGVPAGRVSHPRSRSLVVIATQTLEVGADLDFEFLVTETAGVRALIQRFGRLNRLGSFPHARAVIVHPRDAKPGLYGGEPDAVFERLTRWLGGAEIDLSPANIANALGDPDDAPAHIPELLPVHLWEFAKTSTPPVDAAPPELFFSGLDDPDLTCSIAWRVVLPAADEPIFPALDPREFVDVPIGDARAFLSSHPENAFRITADGTSLRPLDGALKPGDRLVVHVAAGGYDTAHGWDPEITDEVVDLSPWVTRCLYLEQAALENITGFPVPEEVSEVLETLVLGDEDEVDAAADTAAGKFVLEWLAATAFEAGRTPLFDGPVTVGPVERIGPERRPVITWTIDASAVALPSIDALDELSLAPTAELFSHLHSVGTAARRLAEAVGLPALLVDLVGAAGDMHDLGKADPRFQLWLGAPEDQLLAKSNLSRARWRRARLEAGWPQSGRHELLSVQLLDAAATLEGFVPAVDGDLLRHLVIAHHGHGRPLCGVSDSPAPVEASVATPAGEITATLDPGRVDWDQPARFRAACERFGYWGLALLEAIVRQADHLVSGVTEVG